jgi:hypothetical protein
VSREGSENERKKSEEIAGRRDEIDHVEAEMTI